MNTLAWNISWRLPALRCSPSSSSAWAAPSCSATPPTPRPWSRTLRWKWRSLKSVCHYLSLKLIDFDFCISPRLCLERGWEICGLRDSSFALWLDSSSAHSDTQLNIRAPRENINTRTNILTRWSCEDSENCNMSFSGRRTFVKASFLLNTFASLTFSWHINF